MVNQLPQGWKEVLFNSIFDVCNSGKEKIKQSEYLPKADGLLPVVDQGQNLVSGYSDQFQKVVLAKDNPLIVFGDHTRCVKYIDFDFVVGADGTQLIRTKENTLVKLGYYQLMSANIPNNGYSRHFKYVKEQTYKLIADKGEQKYIVDTLDAVAEMIKLRKETIQLTKDLIPAIFQEMFGDPITNPKGWEILSLYNIITQINNGYNPPKKDFGTGIPFVTVNNLYDGLSIDYDSLDKVVVSNKQIQKYKLNYGDICFVRSSVKREGIGQASAYLSNQDAIFGGFVIRVTPNETFNPIFLSEYFQTEAMRNIIINKSVTGVMTNINQPALLSIPVLNVPFSMQEEFAKKVEQINQNLEVQQKDLERLQELFDQLLQKAFTGELTRGDAYGKH